MKWSSESLCSDGKTVTLEAQVMHISPPRLSTAYTQSSSMEELLRTHARLSWQILCAIDRNECRREGANSDESSFTEPPPSLRLDALENFIRGLTGTEDESRLRRCARRRASSLPGIARRSSWVRFISHGAIANRRCRGFHACLPIARTAPKPAFDTGVCHLSCATMRCAQKRRFPDCSNAHEATDPADRLPELPEVHNNLGVARLCLGKWNEAATEFERAAALDGEEPDYWVNLGIAKLAGKQPCRSGHPAGTCKENCSRR